MRYLAVHERMPRGTFDFPIELYYVDASHPRYEMPFHWHMECELIFVLQGSFALSVDEKAVTAQPGDVVFVPGGAVHGGTPKNCVYECIVFDMERLLQDSVICRQRLADVVGDNCQIQTIFKAGSDAARLLDRVFESMEKEMAGYEFLTTGLLWQFIGLVIQQRLYLPISQETERGGRHSSQMKSVLRRIRQDYATPLTLEMLAQEAGMAPRYLCRVFRQITGRTPIDYLNYYRIECAAELLCSQNESITEVALSCGFNDPGYFARLFKRQKSVSASQWRKLHARVPESVGSRADILQVDGAKAQRKSR